MNLVLKHCTENDLEELLDISARTFSEAFESQNNPEDFQAYMKTAFSREKILGELTDPNSLFFFSQDGQDLLGYFKLNFHDAQTEIKDPAAAELERIYVTSEYQGMKIGQWMLEQALEIAQSKNKKYLWLGVWKKNTRAVEFYKKNGFEIFGEHPYYIGEDKQIDWLMKRELE